jgi:hypothetical protein
MTTRLEKELRREILVDGASYTLTLSPEGFRLTEKGRRKGQALRWQDLLSGDAALSQALYASLAEKPPAPPAKKPAAAARPRSAATSRTPLRRGVHRRRQRAP